MQFTRLILSKNIDHGFLDSAELDPCGLIRVRGWSKKPLERKMIPQIRLDDQSIPLLQHYGVSRPDVEGLPGMASSFQPGFVLEYLVPEELLGRRFKFISVESVALGKSSFVGPFDFVLPDYRMLLDLPEVLHREHVYGSGPPNTAVHPDVLHLAKKLPGPLLDFGCGSGALIAELNRLQTSVRGLELQSQTIVQSIKPEVESLITLYDGAFPSPFPAESFRSVFCSEVLEHIPDYQGAVREIARLTSERAVFTVPDISAIPLGFRYSVIPWHLLEGTHVNFFNQRSLQGTLEAHFSKIEFGRICPSMFNDSPYYTSLVAVCLK